MGDLLPSMCSSFEKFHTFVVNGEQVRSLNFQNPSGSNKATSLLFLLLQQSQRKPAEMEDLNETQSLVIQYTQCLGFNCRPPVSPERSQTE